MRRDVRKKCLLRSRLDGPAVKPYSYDARERDFAVPFEPDLLLSHEYFDRHCRKALTPEEKLMLAILEDAVCCFKKNLNARTVAKKQLFREAEEWIFEKDSGWVYSFENICEVLGIDPHYLRKGAIALKENRVKAPREEDPGPPPGQSQGNLRNDGEGRVSCSNGQNHWRPSILKAA